MSEIAILQIATLAPDVVEVTFLGDEEDARWLADQIAAQGWIAGVAKKLEGAPEWTMLVKQADKDAIETFLRANQQVVFAQGQ